MWSEPSPAFHRKSSHVETSRIISRVTSRRDRGKMRSLVWWRPRETGLKEDRKVIWTKATARSSKLRMKCMLSVARWKLMETLKRAFLVIWRNRIQVEENMQSKELEMVEYNSCMHSWFSNSFLKRENYHIKCVHLYKEAAHLLKTKQWHWNWENTVLPSEDDTKRFQLCVLLILVINVFVNCWCLRWKISQVMFLFGRCPCRYVLE